MLSAKIILASQGPHQQKPVIAFKLRYPWQIHGEVMTHRVFSRNASSNRAVPIAKMLEEVRNPELRAYPSFAVVAGKGMQGGRPTAEEEQVKFKEYWHSAALAAVRYAEGLMHLGAAKQDVNRLLMPFTHANVIVTSTEWANFFGLRLDKDADPTMRALAQAMWEEMNGCTIQHINENQWHLPFVDEELDSDTAIKVSVARCARVSYESFETGKRSTVEEDLKLYERLKASRHWSAFEHQARPDSFLVTCWANPDLHGNFNGYIQYRKTMPDESVAPLPEGYTL